MKNLLHTKSDDALRFVGAHILTDKNPIRKKKAQAKGIRKKNASQLEPYIDFLDMAGDLD